MTTAQQSGCSRRPAVWVLSKGTFCCTYISGSLWSFKAFNKADGFWISLKTLHGWPEKLFMCTRHEHFRHAGPRKRVTDRRSLHGNLQSFPIRSFPCQVLIAVSSTHDLKLAADKEPRLCRIRRRGFKTFLILLLYRKECIMVNFYLF